MYTVVKESYSWNGLDIHLETGKIARQADSSVLVKMGESTVLCTVVFNKHAKEDIDFLPLSVHYLERYYSVGKFPGGFIKRECKPSDREVLISRLIDRSIRPLFPKDFFHEISIVIKVLSYDKNVQTDILAIIAASAALQISGLPLINTFASSRVVLLGGSFISQPSLEEREKSDMDLVISGTNNSVLMIESSANEIDEDQLIGAINYGYKTIHPIINLIEKFAQKAKKKDYNSTKVYDSTKLLASLEKELRDSFESAYKVSNRSIRKDILEKIYYKTHEKYSMTDDFILSYFNVCYKSVQREFLRNKIIKTGKRTDGRGGEDIREVNCEVRFLPSTHGSAVFTRGETQSLSVITLGSLQDVQVKDNITGISNDKFTLHYNFHPYSVGENYIPRSPGRREIGHGNLASKAILPILPRKDKFPYTIRVVSEITESNGSSSMATICAAVLSMMDAGIPIKTSVSGIAMGLILGKEDSYTILSDITGEEDSLGDMDFKIAMTKNGINALQMDTKSPTINIDIIQKAISQAKNGCSTILSKMNEVISKPNSNLCLSAPRISSIKVQKDKIKDVIGPGGKNIKHICETTATKIDIADDGNISIFAADKKSLDTAISIIKDITAVPEVKKIYKAKITKVVEFGAFARFLGSNEGLIHISEISNKSISSVREILHKDMYVNVKFISQDNRGKIKLSMKNIDQTSDFEY